MSYLNSLTYEGIRNGKFPLQEILLNSLYYPACDNDGGVVKDCNTLNRALGIESFIYCDYAFGEDRLNQSLDSFSGYQVLAIRDLKPADLTPNGWSPQIPPRLSRNEYLRYADAYKQPFAKWIVYERALDRDETHGPKRFSLVYIGGEGIATYQALYWSNNACPKAVAIIQPGHAFGLNWTDFTQPDGHLHWVITNNPNKQKPIQIYYGGIGANNRYDNLHWEGYEKIRGIKRYYDPSRSGSGYVSIYQLKSDK
jgi:hypothetical protein